MTIAHTSLPIASTVAEVTHSVFILEPLILALLAAVVVGIVVLRRRAGTPPPGRLRKRHILTRLICGGLGAGILIALGIGTWVQVEAAVGASAGEKVLHLPTLPSPLDAVSSVRETAPASDSEQSGLGPRPVRMRLLFHVLVVRATDGVPPVLDAAEFEIGPQDMAQGSPRTASFRIADYQFSVRVRVNQLSLVFTQGRPRVLVTGSFETRTEGPGERISGTAGSWGVGDEVLRTIGPHEIHNEQPLSLLPGPRADGVQVVLLTTVVAEDDPLREVRVEDLAATCADRIRRAMPYRSDRERGLGGTPAPSELRGIVALVPFVGPAGLLLVVAAGLLAQLFLRRPLAMAAWLAVMVLYVAALDRLALASHLGVARDTQAPLAARSNACVQSAGTFFFRDTARGSLDAVAADAGTPKDLAAAAHKSALDLARH